MKTSPFRLLFVLMASYLLSSCSGSQPFYFGKNTGSFADVYVNKGKTNPGTAVPVTAHAADSTGLFSLPVADPLSAATTVDNYREVIRELNVHKLSRRQQRQLQQRLAAVLDTTKKRKRVTIQTNEEKIDDLRNEAERLKESVRADRNGDKVVVSFDDPQSSLSKEAKILIIVVAALLLVALLSLPIIGPVLGIVLGVAVVAAALALVLGIVEIS